MRQRRTGRRVVRAAHVRLERVHGRRVPQEPRNPKACKPCTLSPRNLSPKSLKPRAGARLLRRGGGRRGWRAGRRVVRAAHVRLERVHVALQRGARDRVVARGRHQLQPRRQQPARRWCTCLSPQNPDKGILGAGLCGQNMAWLGVRSMPLRRNPRQPSLPCTWLQHQLSPTMAPLRGSAFWARLAS